MRLPVHTIDEVCSRQLCTGCGACASVEPERFRIGDALDYGRRPFVLENGSPEAGEALAVCPGASLRHTFDRDDPELLSELTDAWGPVYEVWEGHACADDIRLAGSSGGAATALAAPMNSIAPSQIAGLRSSISERVIVRSVGSRTPWSPAWPHRCHQVGSPDGRSSSPIAVGDPNLDRQQEEPGRHD